MNSVEVQNDNVIFECMVSLKNEKYDTLLSLNDKHLLFKKKKGLFKRKYKVIKDILITDIKVVNDKVKIEQKKNKITVYTKDAEVCFTCEKFIDAKKVEEEINKIILGENFLERTVKIGGKVLKNVVQTAGVVAVAATGIYKAVKENKEVLKEASKVVKNIIKK